MEILDFIEPENFAEKEFFSLEGMCLTCCEIIFDEKVRKSRLDADFTLKNLVISDGLGVISRLEESIRAHQTRVDLSPSVMLNHGPIKAVELYWNRYPIGRF